MKLNELKANPGARDVRKRIGRGHGSGTGKTAGKGHKGQLARSGGASAPGFEGGQTPLYRRLPKRGFTNFTRKEYVGVNLDLLNRFEDGTEVTPEILKEAGIVKQQLNGIKILGTGKLEKKLVVKAHKFSKTAKDAIEQAGGSVQEI